MQVITDRWGHYSCKESHGFILVTFYLLFKKKKKNRDCLTITIIWSTSSVPAAIFGIGLKWDLGPVDVLLEDRSVAEWKKLQKHYHILM